MRAQWHNASVARIFISYASQDLDLARDIQARLRQHGHDVFFDREGLKPSDGYDRIIAERISKSDAMVFLCSKASLAEGRYTRTELKLAEQIWPDPAGRILPILLGDADPGDLPSYIKGLSAYQPEGDTVSEVIHMVEKMTKGRTRQRLFKLAGWAAIGLGIAAAIAISVQTWMRPTETVDGRAVLTAELQVMPCSWLGIGQFVENERGIEAEIFGASDLHPRSVGNRLVSELRAQGVETAEIETRRIETIEDAQCPLIDNLVRHRRQGLSRFEAQKYQAGGTEYFRLLFDPSDVPEHIFLFSVEPNGSIQPIYGQAAMAEQQVGAGGGDTRQAVYFTASHEGWGGFIIMQSETPIDPDGFLERAAGDRDAFDDAARADQWQFELAWLNTEG